MKLQKAAGILGVATFAIMNSASSLAAIDIDAEKFRNWYVGASIGNSRADIDNLRVSNRLLAPGFAVSAIDEDDGDTGYKFLVGYQFNPHIAIEGSYFDLGDFSFSSSTSPAGAINGNIDLRGFSLDVVGMLPIRSKLSAFARVGVNYAESEGTFSGAAFNSGMDSNPSEREANPKFGIGLQYAFNYNLAMRLEAERYRVNNSLDDNDDVDLLSVGVVYRFGEPERAAAPVTQPAAATPPPQPRVENITLSTAELFAFDSAELRMPQEKLREIADAVKANSEPREIVIIGYTDHLGSERYNQQLSERRAQAVKNYLVSQGVAEDRLRVEGRGESNPVVNCEDRDRTALINCLQPNRRAEINDITITRAQGQ